MYTEYHSDQLLSLHSTAVTLIFVLFSLKQLIELNLQCARIFWRWLNQDIACHAWLLCVCSESHH